MKPLFAEIIAIKAKVTLIQGNIDQAIDLIEEAKLLIKNLGQVRLSEKISPFEDEIRDNYEDWKNILSSDSSYGQKIEKSAIENYLTNLIKLRNSYQYLPT